MPQSDRNSQRENKQCESLHFIVLSEVNWGEDDAFPKLRTNLQRLQGILHEHDHKVAEENTRVSASVVSLIWNVIYGRDNENHEVFRSRC